jgi:hypothetical protein
VRECSICCLKFCCFDSQLRDLMEHADPTKDKDLIEVRNSNKNTFHLIG